MKARRILEMVLAGATMLLAVLLIVQCVGIYRYGTSDANLTDAGVYIQDVYSWEKVGAAVAQIAWAFWLWLAGFAAAVICRVACPEKKAKPDGMSAETRLKLLRTCVELTPDMQREEDKRRRAGWLLAVFCAACAVPAVMYLGNASHFASRDLEAVMEQLLWHIVPWVLAAFAGVFAWAQYRERSMCREVEAAACAPAKKREPAVEEKQALVRVLRVIVFAAATALIAAGIANGGMYDVLVKAINICTECIGLG